MTSPLLITGASGTVGTALVTELQARNIEFAAMSSKADAIVAGRPAVFGDFADVTSLRTAFADVHTLFLLFPFTPDSVDLARNAVQAAKAAGVKHIVRSSGAGAQAGSPVAVADLQGRIDALVMDSAIAWTLLRPAAFMQNWVTYSAASIKARALRGGQRRRRAQHGRRARHRRGDRDRAGRSIVARGEDLHAHRRRSPEYGAPA